MTEPCNFAAVKQYKDGGEAVIEYFPTQQAALEWIKEQRQSSEYTWCVGEYK